MAIFSEILGDRPFYLDEEKIEMVSECFASLEKKKKIGQLFCINTHSGFKRDLRDVLEYDPGGVFLGINFKRMQRRASTFLQKRSKIPLLLAGDLEMGGLGGAINGTMFVPQIMPDIHISLGKSLLVQ